MFTYEVIIEPAQSDVDAVMQTLIASDTASPNSDPPLNWAVFLIDEATGQKTGAGATGYAVHDWMYIQFVVVPPAARGHGVGRDLMARVEMFARERGLIGIFLDTFEFQARPFYEKLGYSVFGQIEDHPRGLHRYFLKKRLDAAPTL